MVCSFDQNTKMSIKNMQESNSNGNNKSLGNYIEYFFWVFDLWEQLRFP